MNRNNIPKQAQKICHHFNDILKDYVDNIGGKADYDSEFSSIIGATFCHYANCFHIVLPKNINNTFLTAFKIKLKNVGEYRTVDLSTVCEDDYFKFVIEV